jgi:hypothetical protein
MSCKHVHTASHSRGVHRQTLGVKRARCGKGHTCVAVFHFPQELTATALYASPPREAASSLKADIAISLPMITAGNPLPASPLRAARCIISSYLCAVGYTFLCCTGHPLLLSTRVQCQSKLAEAGSLVKSTAPVLSRGTTQALPCRGPHGKGWELRRINTAATISLSATGSKKAPKVDVSFCTTINPVIAAFWRCSLPGLRQAWLRLAG